MCNEWYMHIWFYWCACVYVFVRYAYRRPNVMIIIAYLFVWNFQRKKRNEIKFMNIIRLTKCKLLWMKTQASKKNFSNDSLVEISWKSNCRTFIFEGIIIKSNSTIQKLLVKERKKKLRKVKAKEINLLLIDQPD